MNIKSVVFMGAPGAGKSNLLFRAWLSIARGGSARLIARGLPDELTYLNHGVQKQVAGDYVDHTSSPPDVQSTIPVRFDGESAELVLPDGPGEDWQRLYEDRRPPDSWIDIADRDFAFLLCLRADSTDASVGDWIALQRFRGEQANFRQAMDLSAHPTPLQVVAVDWIQILMRATPGKVRRIGILLTAWDAVAEDVRALGPRSFLEDEYGLLSDFLRNNKTRVDVEIFGTSLFGCDLNTEYGANKVKLSDNPANLGWSVLQRSDGELRTLGILAPVIWAISGTHEL